MTDPFDLEVKGQMQDFSQEVKELKEALLKLAKEIGAVKGDLKNHVTTPDAHNPFGFAE